MSDPKCRILYVDDHEDSSEMFKLVLADADFDVDTAKSFDEALRLAVSWKFDLYVLDKRLPDGSGLDLVRKLNQMTPGVPCVFYSGDAYDVHREEAMAAGADAYVSKPDIEHLIETVRQLVSQRDCAAACSKNANLV